MDTRLAEFGTILIPVALLRIMDRCTMDLGCRPLTFSCVPASHRPIKTPRNLTGRRRLEPECYCGKCGLHEHEVVSTKRTLGRGRTGTIDLESRLHASGQRHTIYGKYSSLAARQLRVSEEYSQSDGSALC